MSNIQNNNMNLKDKFAEFDKAMRNCTVALCKKLNLTEVTTAEGDHGVWTFLADQYAEELGNRCTSEFTVTSSDSDLMVGFRYRFNNIVVSLKHKKRPRTFESMASLEFGTGWFDDEDPNCPEDEMWHKHYHTSGGAWWFKEVMIWGGDTGIELLNIILPHFKETLGDKVKWSIEGR